MILCVVGTKANPSDNEFAREALLLWARVHEENLYLSPHAAPDPKTGAFTPWILRTRL